MRDRTGRSTVRRKRRVRGKTLRRWSVPTVVLAVLSVTMVLVVRRDAEARQLSRDLERLERSEQVVRDELALAEHIADSLSSRARIRIAAGSLGLRPAEDSEITWLEDDEAGS